MSNPGDLAFVSLTLSRGFACFYPRGTSKECILLHHHQAAGTQRAFPTPMGTARWEQLRALLSPEEDQGTGIALTLHPVLSASPCHKVRGDPEVTGDVRSPYLPETGEEKWSRRDALRRHIYYSFHCKEGANFPSLLLRAKILLYSLTKPGQKGKQTSGLWIRKLPRKYSPSTSTPSPTRAPSLLSLRQFSCSHFSQEPRSAPSLQAASLLPLPPGGLPPPGLKPPDPCCCGAAAPCPRVQTRPPKH